MKINDLRGGVALTALPWAGFVVLVFCVPVADCLRLLMILPGDYSLLCLGSQISGIV